ncbi:hypothetical protein CA601_32240 [Paraburkholderia hospita]|nr:hypothetical protein CA601_32240 [Paraburkholderia hospita]
MSSLSPAADGRLMQVFAAQAQVGKIASLLEIPVSASASSRIGWKEDATPHRATLEFRGLPLDDLE